MKDHSIIDQLRADGFEPYCKCPRCGDSGIVQSHPFILPCDCEAESPGTKLAREVREKCNKLTPAERETFRALAMEIINSATPPAP